MAFRRRIVVILGLVCVSISGWSQTTDQVVKWSAKISASPSALTGSKVNAELVAEIESGWHVYAITQPPSGPVPLKVTVPDSQVFSLAGEVTGNEPEHKVDPNFGIDTAFYMRRIVLQVPLLVSRDAAPGAYDARFDVRFQVCNESLCLPPKTTHLTARARVGSPKSKTSQQFESEENYVIALDGHATSVKPTLNQRSIRHGLGREVQASVLTLGSFP